jgi:ATP-dependent DNA ligase
MSLIKKTKPSIQDLFDSEEMVEYHVYDAPRIRNYTEKDLFSVRYTAMTQELENTPHICIVDTFSAADEKEMMGFYESFLKEGYEGLMVRIDAKYYNKRTKYLLKVKPVETEEFRIIGIRPGNGNKAGMAARADFRTKQGKTFTSNIKGTHAYLRELLQRREEVVGELATVEFQNYTPDGIPRFPYMITIRDYE